MGLFLTNFIAYGWDEFIDLAQIRESQKDKFKEAFREKYPSESRPGLATNQMKLFVSVMKPGDIVFIPSEGSQYVAFGIITSPAYIEEISEDDIEAGKCQYKKRRKVAWIKKVYKDQVDPYLFKLMCAINTITDASDFAGFIDRMMHSLYIKDGIGHLVLHIGEEKNISACNMARLISGTIALLEAPEGEEQEINLDDIEVKLNIQSPGPMELIAVASVILALAALLGVVVGGTTKLKITKDAGTDFAHKSDGLIEKLMKWNKQKHEQAKELAAVMDKPKVVVPEQISPARKRKKKKTDGE